MNGFERRLWMKKGLGALSALGLGGLALSACKQVRQEGPAPTNQRPWRAEKVFLFFRPAETGSGWVADPAHKPVTPGQVITWRGFDFKEQIVLTLPEEIFEQAQVTITREAGAGTARVKAEAKPGFYEYQAVVDGEYKVEGGSHPGMIVD